MGRATLDADDKKPFYLSQTNEHAYNLTHGSGG